MIVVRFTDPEEFIEELRRDAQPPGISDWVGSVENSILRITRRWVPDPQGPCQHVLSIAGYVARGQVVVLECKHGEYWGKMSSASDETMTLAEATLGKLEETAKALGLEVRRGAFVTEGRR